MNIPNKFYFRNFLIILIFLTVNYSSIFCQQTEDFAILNKWIKWSNSGSMLINLINEKAFGYLDIRDQEISKLKTEEDWIKRQKKVSEIYKNIIGPFPEKTPLNPKITGILKKDGFRVEKIIYESMPGFYVTSCLFIPDGIRGKRPTVIYVCGHSDLGFREPVYQIFIQNLVRKGFIVFGIDPIGQAERDQYFDPVKNESIIGQGVPTHSYVGSQCFVSGSSLARYFAWDIIRGIDYLETRKEVDMKNLGIAGRSGGGTQSAYASAFDERIKAAAPEAFITSQRRLLESVGTQDAESNLYHAIMNGMEHADFIEVRAPKPMMIVTTTRDYFSIQGARETYLEAKQAYNAFGMSENLILTEDNHIHGSTKKNRESVYWFFQKFLNLPGDPDEMEIEPLTPEELRVTSTGQVSTALGGETVFSLNMKESQKLLEELENSRKNMETHIQAVPGNAKKISGFTAPLAVTETVFCGRYLRTGYSIEMYVLKGAGSSVIPLLLYVPDLCEKSGSIIFLHPEGKTASLKSDANIEQLVSKGYVVAAPDLTGTGETKNTAGRSRDHLLDYPTDNAIVLTGQSIPGIRAADIIRTSDFLKKLGFVNSREIAAVAVGEMGPVLLHAAVFDQDIKHIILLRSPLSYMSLVLNQFYKVRFSSNVPGAIKAYDLPDLIGCIAPRKIALVESTDQTLQTASAETVNRELAFPLSVYSWKKVPENLKIMASCENMNSIVDWCFK